MSKVDVYVKRGRWDSDEKRAIVAESYIESVSATARRHSLQTHQIYNWRRVLAEQNGISDFLRVEVSEANSVSTLPVAFPSPIGGTAAVERLSTGHVEIGLSGVTMRVPISAGSAFVADLAASLSRNLS